ncbi:Cof-type HAD-IIB family hydrolase [Diplocloster modestus]|uniref:Cof-type HAD-IIB family hydrolase n=1 Tax=Diplocloster modestus TaxID=2850322 RepID=A0ABS6K6E8_9FIRM|nr:Cof-type HAD-IIB family hydrolase [Diplocloster modestus]MBU9726085.1 Cof-type HAD-IIB family hydrolase [Diplocloster modestus]
MDRKIIFFDIDNTLYNSNVGIPESARRGIKLLRKNGHIPVICTGRTRAAVFDEITDMAFEGMICGAGTYVEHEGEVIFNKIAEPDQLERLTSLLDQAGAKYFLEGPRYLYYNAADTSTEYRRLGEQLGGSFKPVLRPIEKENTEFNKLIAIRQPQDHWESVEHMLAREYQLVCHNHSPFVEMVPVGHNKATGIQKLLEHLHMDRSDTYAFGDSNNDLEMLEYVEYGIAMGNAYPDVLEKARYRTDPIQEQGIYNGLKKFGLIAG